MNATFLQLVADQMLGLALTDEDAANLVPQVERLRSLVRQIETIGLPYGASISPRSADYWLEVRLRESRR